MRGSIWGPLKRFWSRGACGANDSAYDNSGPSGVVSGRGGQVGPRPGLQRSGPSEGPRGSTTDGYLVLVLDQLGLAIITDRLLLVCECTLRLGYTVLMILGLITLISAAGVDRTRMATPPQCRGRPRNAPAGNESDNGQQEFFAAMTNMANTIQPGMAAATAAHAAATGGGGGEPAGERPMTLANFVKINPPTFQGTTNPTKADDCFQAVKRALLAQQVPENQYVTFATYLLIGEAQYWWRGALRWKREMKSMHLKQGDMSIAAYTHRSLRTVTRGWQKEGLQEEIIGATGVVGCYRRMVRISSMGAHLALELRVAVEDIEEDLHRLVKGAADRILVLQFVTSVGGITPTNPAQGKISCVLPVAVPGTMQTLAPTVISSKLGRCQHHKRECTQ
ncbi:hypothetical protein PIB30_022960 [Stylosanthes scabra]|uniref:Uncharacterized protein n=1 Tax=Stylosanthes scabra TaxID=79078 RepID=A0ABU6S9M5_9FABA|nr:hypothetical protein [Stylosanthes scabra]